MDNSIENNSSKFNEIPKIDLSDSFCTITLNISDDLIIQNNIINKSCCSLNNTNNLDRSCAKKTRRKNKNWDPGITSVEKRNRNISLGGGVNGFNEIPRCSFQRQDYEPPVDDEIIFQNNSKPTMTNTSKRVKIPRLRNLSISFPNRSYMGEVDKSVFVKTKSQLIKLGKKCGIIQKPIDFEDNFNSYEIDEAVKLNDKLLLDQSSSNYQKAVYKSYKSEIDLTKNLNYLDAFLNENFDKLCDAKTSTVGRINTRVKRDGNFGHKRTKSCSKSVTGDTILLQESKRKFQPVQPSISSSDSFSNNISVKRKDNSDKSGKSNTTSSSMSSSDYASVYSGPSNRKTHEFLNSKFLEYSPKSRLKPYHNRRRSRQYDEEYLSQSYQENQRFHNEIYTNEFLSIEDNKKTYQEDYLQHYQTTKAAALLSIHRSNGDEDDIIGDEDNHRNKHYYSNGLSCSDSNNEVEHKNLKSSNSGQNYGTYGPHRVIVSKSKKQKGEVVLEYEC